LGGTSRVRDSLRISSSDVAKLITLAQGTIELELYYSAAFTTPVGTRFILDHENNAANVIGMFFAVIEPGYDYGVATGGSGPISQPFANPLPTMTVGTWHKFTIAWDSTSLKGYIDGALVAQEDSPNLPLGFEIMQILDCVAENVTESCDTMVRGLYFHKTKLSDAQISAGAGSTAESGATAFAFQTDLLGVVT
jgi:hypothetical protein